MSDNNDKIILMGLGASGKTSIYSLVFDRKKPEEIKEYKATIQYERIPKKIVKDFQIIDCGGQDSYLNSFLSDQKSEFIFSNLNSLIWVVSVNDIQNISTSKYYFDNAIKIVSKISPNANINVLFHKIDLIKESHKVQLINELTDFFRPINEIKICFWATSIFDNSVFKCFGSVVQQLIKSETKIGNLSEKIDLFREKNSYFYSIAVYSKEGLPVFENGDYLKLDNLGLIANLTLNEYEQMDERLGLQSVLVTTMETENDYYFFKRIKDNFILAGIASKNFNHELEMQLFNALEDYIISIFD